MSMSDRDDPPPTEDLFEEFFSRRDPDREHDRQRTKVLSEFVRRTLENAVGQVQQSSTVPREALSFLLQQGDRGKREVVRIIGTEVGDFLRHIDIATEVTKVLDNLQVDVQASVKFRRTGEGLAPEVTHSSEVHVSDPSDDELDIDPEGDEH